MQPLNSETLIIQGVEGVNCHHVAGDLKNDASGYIYHENGSWPRKTVPRGGSDLKDGTGH